MMTVRQRRGARCMQRSGLTLVLLIGLVSLCSLAIIERPRSRRSDCPCVYALPHPRRVRKFRKLDIPSFNHMVRLYVGGLSEDVTPGELAQRFRAFGDVTSCEVAAVKSNDTLRAQTTACRGFGFVEVAPKDEIALRKCLTTVRHPAMAASKRNIPAPEKQYPESGRLMQYNGSKWKGRALRVQQATPHFSSKLQTEWAEDAAAALAKSQERDSCQSLDVQQGTLELTLIAPDGQEVTVRANERQSSFPETPAKRLQDLDWEGLPPTAGVERRRRFEQAMGEIWASQAAARATKKAEARRKAQYDSDSSEELDAVDFTEGKDADGAQVADLSRFSSDEEDMPSLAHDARKRQRLDPAAEPDPEAEALWEEQGGLTTYLAALDASSSGGESSHSEDGSEPELESDTPPLPLQSVKLASEQRSKHTSPERSPGIPEDGETLEHTHDESSELQNESPLGEEGVVGQLSPSEDGRVSEDDSSNGDPVSTDDSTSGEEAEEPELGPEAASTGALSNGELAAPKEEEEASAVLMGHATPAKDGSVDEEDAIESDPEEEEDEEPDLANIYKELTAGVQFWAGGEGAGKLLEQWRANKDKLAADAKQARRDALRRGSGVRRSK